MSGMGEGGFEVRGFRKIGKFQIMCVTKILEPSVPSKTDFGFGFVFWLSTFFIFPCNRRYLDLLLCPPSVALSNGHYWSVFLASNTSRCQRQTRTSYPGVTILKNDARCTRSHTSTRFFVKTCTSYQCGSPMSTCCSLRSHIQQNRQHPFDCHVLSSIGPTREC